MGMALLVAVPLAMALDLGVQGPTYPVIEPDLLRTIQERLLQKQRSGEIERLQREAAARAHQLAEAPVPVAGLARTTQQRVFHFNPAYTVPRTLYGPGGEVIVAAGTQINPLAYVGLSRPLFFFDARDADQVRKALAFNHSHTGGVKLILTAGKPLDFMRRYRLQAFFDQGGTLVRRMGIQQVPALVTQDQKTLRIEELLI
jgi:conjugal transfer pilus assembly protein TraW